MFRIGKATEGSAKWNPKKFPDFAVTYGLVLTGWGPNIRSTPTREWTDRKAGSLTQANWWDLVQRIPHEYKSNPHHLVLAGEMSLEFITIEEYLQDHPGMFFTSNILAAILIFLRARRTPALRS